jgi:hypothetical protein
MKRSRFFKLTAAAMFAAAAGAAQAQPIASLGKAGVTHAETAMPVVVKAGWKVKRRAGKRYRTVQRKHRGNRLGLRGDRRTAAMGPYLPPGVVSMLLSRKKHDRCELLPGGC